MNASPFNSPGWYCGILALADARTETEPFTVMIDGFQVKSCKRGAKQPDYMAWVNGNRAVWGCGPTREAAISDAIRTAKSL